MLVLSGPRRGLVLVDFIYLEIDLKIKEDGVYPDRQFSKGLMSIDGRALSREKDVVVRSDTLESWLSTMEVRFATTLNAVEGTKSSYSRGIYMERLPLASRALKKQLWLMIARLMVR